MEEEKIIETVNELIQDKKISKLKKFLDEINEYDFPAIIESIDEDKLIMIYRLLSKEKAADVFVELDSDDQERLINSLTDKEIKNVMNEIYMDDAADLIEEMPSNVVKRILANTKAEDRKIINELLKYPDDTAGSIMTTEFVDLKENMTVNDAFLRIKKKGLRSENIYTTYVLTLDRKILGVVDIKKILTSDRNVLVKDIMDTNFIKANTLEDQEDVSKLFDKYDLVAIPVVDKEDRLVGIITVDDAIDAYKEEVDEDFEKMAAMAPTEDDYLQTSVWEHFKSRIVWLIVLMLSSIITGKIITNYENAISAWPILVSFVPMLMGTGGNSGSQTSTLMIRGMATDEIRPSEVLRAMWKEIRVAVIVGIVLAVVNIIRVAIMYQDIKAAIVVSVTMIFTVIVAKLIGCILPLGAKAIKLDPAIMAAPLITTVTDCATVFMYFSLISLVYPI